MFACEAYLSGGARNPRYPGDGQKTRQRLQTQGDTELISRAEQNVTSPNGSFLTPAV